MRTTTMPPVGQHITNSSSSSNSNNNINNSSSINRHQGPYPQGLRLQHYPLLPLRPLPAVNITVKRRNPPSFLLIITYRGCTLQMAALLPGPVTVFRNY